MQQQDIMRRTAAKERQEALHVALFESMPLLCAFVDTGRKDRFNKRRKARHLTTQTLRLSTLASQLL